jgi:hypothetical protein
MTSRRPALAALVLTGLLVSGCSLSGSSGPDPEKAAVVLAAALQGGDVAKVPFVVAGSAARYTALAAGLKRFASTVRVVKVTTSGARATATLGWRTNLEGQLWRHTTTATLAREANVWRVVWAPSILESSLVPGETLAVTRINAARADILGASGTPIVEPRPVVRFGIDKANTPPAALALSSRRLAQAVGITVAPFVKATAAAGPKEFVPAIVLRRSDVTSVLLGRVSAIPGARAISDHLPLAPSKDFAAALLGTVGPAAHRR